MHYGDDGWGNGSWILMTMMMIFFWGGLIWLGVVLLRRGNHVPFAHTHGPELPVPPAPRPAPQDILAERLARGEIEPDDYRQRLDALRRSQADPDGKA